LKQIGPPPIILPGPPKMIAAMNSTSKDDLEEEAEDWEFIDSEEVDDEEVDDEVD